MNLRFEPLLLLLLIPPLVSLPSSLAAGDYWVVLTSMPTPRASIGVVAVNGKIYAIGGSYGHNGEVEAYDPIRNVWTSATSMPTPRSFFGIAVFDGKIYTFGGDAGNWNTGEKITNVVEVYDPATDAWERKSFMPTAKMALSASVVNGKIYVIGGRVGSLAGSCVSSVEIYDPLTDNWTTASPLPISVSYHVSVVLDGKIYVIGGCAGNNVSVNIVQIYNPETDSWSLGQPLPVGVDLAAACVTTGVFAPKRIYVIGGKTNIDAVNIVQIYDPETGKWSIGSSMPTPRYALGAASVNDIIYAVGGRIGWTLQETGANEMYVPDGHTNPPSPPQPMRVCIGADGTVSPEDAPIKRFGSLYVLEGDLFGSIAIHRDNVIIDGAGYALRGNGEGTGIELYGRTNVTIRNLQITGFEKAISAQQVSNSTFCCNALEGNTMGLWFIGCGDNKIIFNMIRNNREGICLFYNSDGNIVTMNSIFGDSVLPWMSINNIIDMNYWSTYNGTDYDGDGIGDQPHVFFTANSITFLDWHPLMESRVPWELPYSLADSWNGPLSSPVTILSPINGTCYRISQIPLVVAFKACVGGNLQYSIYSLDGDRNAALAVIQCPRDPYSLTAVIIGISALWNITEGTHELAIFTECYRTDVAQTIGTSLQRVRFTVETKHTDSLEIQYESNEEPRQTMPPILVLIAVIAAAFAIILFISRIRVQQHSER